MPAETAADRDAAPEPGAGGWSSRLFMTWEELREMTHAGMEIGLHSHDHPNIAQLSTAELEADLDANLQSITQRIHVTPVAYAVPFGGSRHTHPDLRSILARRGLRHALLATHGWNDASVPPALPPAPRRGPAGVRTGLPARHPRRLL
jgi:peptidoglycan/xylan/chitin deacetylase (PgdA/CDA1 family)